MPAPKRRSTNKSTGNEPAPKLLAMDARDEQEATIKAKLDEMRSFMEQRFTALEEQLSVRPPVGNGNSGRNGENQPTADGDNDDDAVSLSEQNQGDNTLDADPGPSAQRTRPEVIAKRLCSRVGGQHYDTSFVWRAIGHCEAFVELFDAVAQATLNGHDMTRIIERFKEPLTQSFKSDFDRKIQELRDEGADISQMIKHISIAGESALGNILKGAHISIMRAFSKLRRDTEYDKRVVRLDALFRDDCLSLDYVIDALYELFEGLDKSRIDPKMVSDIKSTIMDAKELYTKVAKVVEDQKEEKEMTRNCEKVKVESNMKVTQLRSTIDRQAQEIANLRAQLARKNAEEKPSTSGASL